MPVTSQKVNSKTMKEEQASAYAEIDPMQNDKVTKKTKNVGDAKTVDPKQAVIDAAKALEDATTQLMGGKVVVKMERENQSYITPDGVKFTKEHPFQLVTKEEAERLGEYGFRRASPSEIAEYYSK